MHAYWEVVENSVVFGNYPTHHKQDQTSTTSKKQIFTTASSISKSSKQSKHFSAGKITTQTFNSRNFPSISQCLSFAYYMQVLIASHESVDLSTFLTESFGLSPPPPPLKGYIAQSTVQTKYFTSEVGVWVDQFDDPQEWANEYTSDEAEIVRNKLILFIYLYRDEVHPGIAGLVNMLPTGTSLAVDTANYDTSLEDTPNAKSRVSEAQKLELLGSGFDVVNKTEFKSALETAIYDSNAELHTPSPEDKDVQLEDELIESERDIHKACSETEPRDLNSIFDELSKARADKSMSNAEKQALADRIAEELLSTHPF